MNVSNVLLHLIHKAVVSKYIKKYIQDRNPMNIINVLKPFYITIIFKSVKNMRWKEILCWPVAWGTGESRSPSTSSFIRRAQACMGTLMLLEEGDLDSPVPQATGQDETAELTRSTAEMVTGLNTIINDIRYLLTEMSRKNLDIQSAHREAYVGGFQSILQSMRTLKVELRRP